MPRPLVPLAPAVTNLDAYYRSKLHMRYILGPSFGPLTFTAPAEPAPPAKADVMPALVSADPAAGVTVAVPAYDPATQAVPSEYRAYFVPLGSTPPGDAPSYTTSPYACTVATDAVQAEGGNVTIPAPTGLPAGDYFGQVILGFAV